MGAKNTKKCIHLAEAVHHTSHGIIYRFAMCLRRYAILDMGLYMMQMNQLDRQTDRRIGREEYIFL
jgi:hypothetical protein